MKNKEDAEILKMNAKNYENLVLLYVINSKLFVYSSYTSIGSSCILVYFLHKQK